MGEEEIGGVVAHCRNKRGGGGWGTAIISVLQDGDVVWEESCRRKTLLVKIFCKHAVLCEELLGG